MTVKKYFPDEKPKETNKTWFEILVILTMSLAALTAGILATWPSPFIVKIVNDKEHYDITEEEASYFTVISVIGPMVLAPFWAPVVTKIGKKKLLLFTSGPYILTYLIKAFATNLWLFYFARLLTGVGDSITFTCLVPFIGEIATPEVRGVWGNAIVWAGFLGQFIINVLGIYYSVMTTSFILVGIPICFCIVFAFMPESPYFLIGKNQHEQAKIALKRLRRKNNIEEEFDILKIAVEKQSQESGAWKDLITNRTNRKALLVALFLRMSQIFSGIFTFVPYIQLIFQKSGTNINPELCTIIYTFVNFILYSSAAYWSNKMGRRLSLISSLCFTSVVFMFLATYFCIDKYFPEINLDSIRWFPLAGLLAYLVFSCYGVGTVPFIMPGELFSTSIKAKGVAVVLSGFAFTNFIINNLFYYLINATGLFGPFLMFGICNIFSAIIAYKFLPETKNKTLEEIQIILSK